MTFAISVEFRSSISGSGTSLLQSFTSLNLRIVAEATETGVVVAAGGESENAERG